MDLTRLNPALPLPRPTPHPGGRGRVRERRCHGSVSCPLRPLGVAIEGGAGVVYPEETDGTPSGAVRRVRPICELPCCFALLLFSI